MSKLNQEEEAQLTVEWLGKVREAQFQEELKYVPRFDDTTGSLKLILDETLYDDNTIEGEVVRGVEKFETSPVTYVDLDEAYYRTEESYEVIDRVLDGLRMLPSEPEEYSPVVFESDPQPLPRRKSLLEAFDEIVQHVQFDSIEEECQAFMEIIHTSLEDFQKEMDEKWAELLAPVDYQLPSLDLEEETTTEDDSDPLPVLV